MCTSSRIELSRSMYRRARRFYVTRTWGMNIDPVTLTAIFESFQSAGDRPLSADARIKVNSEVTVLDLQENQTCTLNIVPPQESNPEKGVISFLSPLGAALINKSSGDTISIPVLGSRMRYRILNVRN